MIMSDELFSFNALFRRNLSVINKDNHANPKENGRPSRVSKRIPPEQNRALYRWVKPVQLKNDIEDLSTGLHALWAKTLTQNRYALCEKPY